MKLTQEQIQLIEMLIEAKITRIVSHTYRNSTEYDNNELLGATINQIKKQLASV